MNTVIKQDLFRHRDTASAALNNLCTIVHHLSGEGAFTGEVGVGDRVLGRFRLRCSREEKSTQVNVDLSKFDELYRVNAPNRSHSTDLVVGKEGYVVFHASGHHRDLWATLSKVEGEKPAPECDTRSLNAGDLVVFRLWYPGAYALANKIGGAKGALIVSSPRQEEMRFLTSLEPVRVTLSARGFEPAEVNAAPTQAIIVQLETPAAVTLTTQEAGKTSGPARR